MPERERPARRFWLILLTSLFWMGTYPRIHSRTHHSPLA